MFSPKIRVLFVLRQIEGFYLKAKNENEFLLINKNIV